MEDHTYLGRKDGDTVTYLDREHLDSLEALGLPIVELDARGNEMTTPKRD